MAAKRCSTLKLLLVPLAVLSLIVPLVGLSSYSTESRIRSWLQVLSKHEPSLIDASASKARFKEDNESFGVLVWAPDFSSRSDTSFILDFAARLKEMGLQYQIMLESPFDGLVLQELDFRYDYAARVNPRLRALLSGESRVWRDALGPKLPQMIIFCSSLWSHFFLKQPPSHPDVRLAWYYYESHRCDEDEDSGCVEFQRFGEIIF